MSGEVRIMLPSFPTVRGSTHQLPNLVQLVFFHIFDSGRYSGRLSSLFSVEDRPPKPPCDHLLSFPTSRIGASTSGRPHTLYTLSTGCTPVRHTSIQLGAWRNRQVVPSPLQVSISSRNWVQLSVLRAVSYAALVRITAPEEREPTMNALTQPWKKAMEPRFRRASSQYPSRGLT